MKHIYLIIFFSSFACALEPMDDYYADDLLDAVDKAKSSPHHYDYSNHYRYKRSTAQSIELNRLNLKELDETMLKNSTNKSVKTDLLISGNLEHQNKNQNDYNLSESKSSKNDIPTISQPLQQLTPQAQLGPNGLIDRSSITSSSRP